MKHHTTKNHNACKQYLQINSVAYSNYNLALIKATAKYTMRMSANNSFTPRGEKKQITICLQYIEAVQDLIYKIDISEPRRARIEDILVDYEDLMTEREDALRFFTGSLPKWHSNAVLCGIVNSSLRLRSAILKVMPKTR